MFVSESTSSEMRRTLRKVFTVAAIGFVMGLPFFEMKRPSVLSARGQEVATQPGKNEAAENWLSRTSLAVTGMREQNRLLKVVRALNNIYDQQEKKKKDPLDPKPDYTGINPRFTASAVTDRPAYYRPA